jgi:hypothetical protein
MIRSSILPTYYAKQGWYMIDIFYPLGGKSAWDDNEIRYSLRSLEANLDTDFRVTIYSDHIVDWLQNVNFQFIPRYFPGGRASRDFENFFDTLNKILTFTEEVQSDQFVYMYDDCLLIRKVGDFDAVYNVALQEETAETLKMRGDKHGQTIRAAIDIVKPYDKLWNYETHIPRVYGCYRLMDLFLLFDILRQPVPPALATMYFNFYHRAPYALMKDTNLRASFCFEDDPDTGCYMASNRGQITQACENKMFLHYNDTGLRFSPNGVPILKEYIQDLFPNKSKFEK